MTTNLKPSTSCGLLKKKLEQILCKFLPEEVESWWWQKTAGELGNLTAKEVACHVQKYFIKLTKASIPVPGRIPDLYIYSRKSSTSRRQHPCNKRLFNPSIFMTSHEPPVYMDEDDDQSCLHSHMSSATEEASDKESILVIYRSLHEYKELLQFKKLKKKKQKFQQMQAESGFVQYVGFKCDSCGVETIQDVRCTARTVLQKCLWISTTLVQTAHMKQIFTRKTTNCNLFVSQRLKLPRSFTNRVLSRTEGEGRLERKSRGQKDRRPS